MTGTTEQLRKAVRDRYAEIARGDRQGCGTSSGSGCCGPSRSEGLGYAGEDLAMLPEGADLGLGCGNPAALASLRAGDTVLDLGSGAGIDCFLAAREVGETGRVIGVDMTPDMIDRARANVAKVGARNVEFRLGEIENLPVADASVDVVISNCVVNLSTDKARVYREAFRVLRPGGRVAISDIVAVGAMPESVRADVDQYSGCVSGAVPAGEIRTMLEGAGFTGVTITERATDADAGIPFVRSAAVVAVKPA
ncbi:MAG: arsenite methyltransferase [Candidatus Eiseniibacteriota bacterium]